MASLSGVSNSNYLSSLMNSANTITGLASGLDTESMIESLVQSYQTKINQFNQKITKVEWKQEAYRSIISQLYNFANKYTSYTSNTNLMSRSFFSSAVKVAALGKYAGAVTASGKTSSEISLDSVQQLATAAQYRTKSNLGSGDTGTITGKQVDLLADDTVELSNLSGSLTFTYGTRTVKISFDETEDVDAINDIREKLGSEATDSEVLAELINKKLADQEITFTSGNTESADQRIKATADGDKITFSEIRGGNGVYISKASGNIASKLGLSSSDLANASKNKITSVSTSKIEKNGLTRTMSGVEYLAEQSGETMSVTLDGTTKSITLPKVKVSNNKYYINGAEVKDPEKFADEYTKALQTSLKKAFGDKVTVENKGEDGSLKLEFKVANEGSELVINSSAGDALGIGTSTASYLTTSKTLEDLMETDENGDLKGLTAVDTDDKGNKLYEFKINDVVIGKYTKNTTLDEIMEDINKNEEAGVKVAYSQTTQNFTFTAKETGSDGKIEMGEGLASAMFGVNSDAKASEVFKGLDFGEDGKGTQSVTFKIPGGNAMTFSVGSDTTIDDIIKELQESPLGHPNAEGYSFSYDKTTGQILAARDGKTQALDVSVSGGEKLEYAGYTQGQDAKFTVTINGETMDLTRSSNTTTIDGLTITMSDTFNVDENGAKVKGESVTFKTSTDSDKIIDTIKEMVNDYNAMMSEIKSAYSTMPYQNSNGSYGGYEPLTEDDMSGMTESAVARYEEKAKQGILFGDRDLSALYSKMLEAFTFSNKADGETLREMGISISYNSGDGSQAVTIDEEKLRAMLDSDPDRVADLFNKNDGIMDRMKTQLDAYAKTTGEPKGILVQKSGTPLSSLSLMSNTWQTEIDNYNKQIEKWQTKLQAQVERYTSQFTRLETLINQMNSQSSALSGMLGG